MHVQVILVLFVAVASQASLPSSIMGHFPFPDHPNQCKDVKTGQFYNVNDTWRDPNYCVQKLCGFEEPHMTIQTTLCSGPSKVNCRQMPPIDAAGPYPDCCFRYDCGTGTN